MIEQIKEPASKMAISRKILEIRLFLYAGKNREDGRVSRL